MGRGGRAEQRPGAASDQAHAATVTLLLDRGVASGCCDAREAVSRNGASLGAWTTSGSAPLVETGERTDHAVDLLRGGDDAGAEGTYCWRYGVTLATIPWSRRKVVTTCAGSLPATSAQTMPAERAGSRGVTRRT